jgi:hypothetical protein
MPTEQEREIRYLREQVDDILGEFKARVDGIDQSFRRLADAIEISVNSNREFIGILRDIADTLKGAKAPAPAPSLFDEVFSGIAKKNPPRKPTKPKLKVVKPPPDDENGGPGAA